MIDWYKEYLHWKRVALIALTLLSSVIGSLIAALVIKLL